MVNFEPPASLYKMEAINGHKHTKIWKNYKTRHEHTKIQAFKEV